jgi:protein TonB
MKTKHIVNPIRMLNILLVLTLFIFIFSSFISCASGKKAAVSGAGTAGPAAQENPAVKQKSDDAEKIPYVVVEEMPVFPGGDSMLLDYIARNTKYPDAAKTRKAEGRVILRFCVTETGNVDKISILRSVDPELDAEAIRVTETLPRFKPGRQGGKDVPVWYMIPVTFALK